MKLRSSYVCLTSALTLLGCGSGSSTNDDCSGSSCHLGSAGQGGALSSSGGSGSGATSGSGSVSGSGAISGSGSAAGTGAASSGGNGGGDGSGGSVNAPEPPSGFYQMEDLDRGLVAV